MHLRTLAEKRACVVSVCVGACAGGGVGWVVREDPFTSPETKSCPPEVTKPNHPPNQLAGGADVPRRHVTPWVQRRGF